MAMPIEVSRVWVVTALHCMNDYKPGDSWSSNARPMAFTDVQAATAYRARQMLAWLYERVDDYGERVKPWELAGKETDSIYWHLVTVGGNNRWRLRDETLLTDAIQPHLDESSVQTTWNVTECIVHADGDPPAVHIDDGDEDNDDEGDDNLDSEP